MALFFADKDLGPACVKLKFYVVSVFLYSQWRMPSLGKKSSGYIHAIVRHSCDMIKYALQQNADLILAVLLIVNTRTKKVKKQTDACMRKHQRS